MIIYYLNYFKVKVIYFLKAYLIYLFFIDVINNNIIVFTYRNPSLSFVLSFNINHIFHNKTIM